MFPYRKLRGKLRVITVTLPALRTILVVARTVIGLYAVIFPF